MEPTRRPSLLWLVWLRSFTWNSATGTHPNFFQIFREPVQNVSLHSRFSFSFPHLIRPIHVCCAYPPDTQTPGFEEENLTKPEETHLISEDGELARPEDVGRKMLQEALKPNPPFAICFNFDAWMLSNLTAGMGPTSSILDVVAQIAAMGIFRVISLFYLNRWWHLLRNFKPKAEAKNATPTSDYGSTRRENSETQKSEWMRQCDPKWNLQFIKHLLVWLAKKYRNTGDSV